MIFNTEIFIFETSAAFRENQEIVTNALKPTLQAEGANTLGYYGLQIENPNTGYVVIHWDNYEIHRAFAKHPIFPSVHEAFKPSLGGSAVVYDVQFSGPTVALEQPVTEILIFTLKEPENRQAIVDMLIAFSKGGNLTVFGQTRQDENKYVVLSGWASLEAHQEAARKPEVAAALTKLFSLVDKEHLYHTSLTKYSL